MEREVWLTKWFGLRPAKGDLGADFVPTADVRLQIQNGKFFLLIPYDKNVPQLPTREYKWKTVALDPGVRTFMTFYASENEAGELGMKSFEFLKRTVTKRQISLCRKGLHLSRYKRAWKKYEAKQRNQVDDMHWKACHYLLRNAENVLIPKFDTIQMVRRQGRKIHPVVAKTMYRLRHYTFRQRLIMKASEYPGRTVVVCNEAYTTKQCGRCGFIRESFSGERFKCQNVECDLHSPRDLHAARNILLKNTRECDLNQA